MQPNFLTSNSKPLWSCGHSGFLFFELNMIINSLNANAKVLFSKFFLTICNILKF